MTGNFNIGKSWFRLAWLSVAVLLSICSLNVVGQILDTSGPDRAHCVSTGNLYATTPGINNGKPVCQFADRTWCDAHAFFTGNCSGNSRSYYANYNTPMSALDLLVQPGHARPEVARFKMYTRLMEMSTCAYSRMVLQSTSGRLAAPSITTGSMVVCWIPESTIRPMTGFTTRRTTESIICLIAD